MVAQNKAPLLDPQVAECISRWQDVPGALLPLLHEVQEACGYIPPDSLPAIAQALGLSVAEVHGVVSFYPDFRSEAGGEHRVQICRAEACQAMGGRELQKFAQELLGISWGETTADGKVSLDEVFCLGNCACSPSVRIDDAVHARVDTERFTQLMQTLGCRGVNP